VAAAARAGEDICLSDVPDRLARPLGQSNLGIAAKQTEPTAYAVCTREATIEHGNALNPTISDTGIRELRVNATESKWLQRRPYSHAPHFARQPFCGVVIYCCPGAMVTLRIKGLKHARHALFKLCG